LEIGLSEAYIWRQRWYDSGWIEALAYKKYDYYQITEEGQKVVRTWIEKAPSEDINGSLLLTIPRHNPKKAAEQLIKGLDPEQLREIHKIIDESFNLDSS
jgi:DNA-binding PadR family transcriptional regulator